MSRHWKPPGKIVRIRPVKGKRLRSLDEFEPAVRTSWHGANQPPPKLPAYFGGGGGGRGRLPEVAKAGLLLMAAACVGIAIGAYQVLGPREIVAPEALSQKIETIVPPVVEDAADAEWAARGGGRASTMAETDRPPDGPGFRPSALTGGAGVRASFSYCKWGGGTNCVVDGDTFYLNGAKVRIAGIDAPETHDYRCRSELELGERAARQLQALLNSGAVTMTGSDRDRDTYGRLLRNVSVNGQDVGDALVSAGLARPYAGGRRSWCH